MVHTFECLGRYFAVDGNCGAVHELDKTAFDIITEMAKRDDAGEELTRGAFGAQNAECEAEIWELIDAGELFSKDDFSDLSAPPEPGLVKALCLHVAHSCNLNCAYCFAGGGRYRGESALMTAETGKRALDFLVARSAGRHNLEVDFFGGEPLLNFGVVKEITAYARTLEKQTGKHFRFTLTTNGMLLDDAVTEFLNAEMDNVVLSLDGRKSVHDRFRVDFHGQGSFDRVVPKFQRFAAARGEKSYYMRGTFTHQNPDFINDIRCMLDLGFTSLSMEPVVCAEDDPNALTKEDLPAVFDSYEELAALMIRRREEGRPFTFYHYMLDLERGPCVYKRLKGCGSGTEYLAVTPAGELYPCHRFVGEEAFRLGDLETGVVNRALTEEFAKTNVLTRAECGKCWARMFCAGGCAANAYYASGSVSGVYPMGCEMFRKRLECAMAAGQ